MRIKTGITAWALRVVWSIAFIWLVYPVPELLRHQSVEPVILTRYAPDYFAFVVVYLLGIALCAGVALWLWGVYHNNLIERWQVCLTTFQDKQWAIALGSGVPWLGWVAFVAIASETDIWRLAGMPASSVLTAVLLSITAFAGLASGDTRRRAAATLGKLTYIVVVSAVLLAFALKVYDLILIKQHGPVRPDPRVYEVYPYDGFHFYSNIDYHGPMPFESDALYSDFELRSGDHGFFVDFDLENPPPKEPDEFRIILIGGSGAQGWGAQTNDDMLYRVLERNLNAELQSQDITVRVINLAMGGSLSYQNYIALNLWGHQLEPDLILSLSGNNDYVVPLINRSNAPSGYYDVMGSVDMNTSFLAPASFVSYEQPPTVSFLQSFLPGLMSYTSLGPIARQYYYDYYVAEARRNYIDNFGYAESGDIVSSEEARQAARDIAIPLYVHAFQSIKRDFMGIPILIAYQPATSDHQHFRDAYDEFRSSATEELRGYMNDEWYFVDIHQYWIDHDLFADGRYGNVHYTNVGHALIADILTEELLPIIREMRDSE